MENKHYTFRKGKLEYKKFRVRTPIKTFRDLDVYKDTTKLAADIFNLKAPARLPKYAKEFEVLYEIAKHIPRLIAESYSNKFDNFALSQAKLEKASEIISTIIAKLEGQLKEVKAEIAKVYHDNYRVMSRQSRLPNQIAL